MCYCTVRGVHLVHFWSQQRCDPCVDQYWEESMTQLHTCPLHHDLTGKEAFVSKLQGWEERKTAVW